MECNRKEKQNMNRKSIDMEYIRNDQDDGDCLCGGPSKWNEMKWKETRIQPKKGFGKNAEHPNKPKNWNREKGKWKRKNE